MERLNNVDVSRLNFVAHAINGSTNLIIYKVDFNDVEYLIAVGEDMHVVVDICRDEIGYITVDDLKGRKSDLPALVGDIVSLRWCGVGVHFELHAADRTFMV